MLQVTPLALAEGGSSLISPDGSLIVVFFLFLIFVFVLNRILFRPISRVLDEREARTEGAMAEARAAIHQYQSRLANYEEQIRHAKAAAYQQQEKHRAASLAERARLIDEVKQEAAAEIAAARGDIERQVQVARQQLASDARQIADQISRAVLGRAVGGGAD